VALGDEGDCGLEQPQPLLQRAEQVFGGGPGFLVPLGQRGVDRFQGLVHPGVLVLDQQTGPLLVGFEGVDECRELAGDHLLALHHAGLRLRHPLADELQRLDQLRPILDAGLSTGRPRLDRARKLLSLLPDGSERLPEAFLTLEAGVPQALQLGLENPHLSDQPALQFTG
jgi:hypothetical protein